MANDLAPEKRAAAVVIALGSDCASEIYKYLSEDDVERLTYEIAQLQSATGEQVENAMDDFYKLCLTKKVLVEGGMGYAKDVLEKAFGPQIATSLLEKVNKSIKNKAFDFLRKADVKNIVSIIGSEHPQVIALVLSYASADQASKVLAELPKEKRVNVVERIATMEPAQPEMVRLVESALEKKFSSVSTVKFQQVGGINCVADIINAMDRATEKYIFDELKKSNAPLAEEINKMMFVFEDIVVLGDMDIQKFLRVVDQRDLVYALKGANAEVSAKILANMSKRMAESVQSDLEITSNVRLRDVEEAQQRIVSSIRKLEEENELVILKGGKDDVIA